MPVVCIFWASKLPAATRIPLRSRRSLSRVPGLDRSLRGRLKKVGDLGRPRWRTHKRVPSVAVLSGETPRSSRH